MAAPDPVEQTKLDIARERAQATIDIKSLTHQLYGGKVQCFDRRDNVTERCRPSSIDAVRSNL